DDPVRSASFNPDGRRVTTAAASSDNLTGSVRVWDAITGEPLSHPVKTNGRVLAFSHNGRRMVTGGWSPRVWDLATGKAVSEVLKHTLVLTDAEFSPDDQRVITASFDGTARIWDTTTGAAITPPLKHNAAVAHVSLS